MTLTKTDSMAIWASSGHNNICIKPFNTYFDFVCIPGESQITLVVGTIPSINHGTSEVLKKEQK